MIEVWEDVSAFDYSIVLKVMVWERLFIHFGG